MAVTLARLNGHVDQIYHILWDADSLGWLSSLRKYVNLIFYKPLKADILVMIVLI